MDRPVLTSKASALGPILALVSRVAYGLVCPTHLTGFPSALDLHLSQEIPHVEYHLSQQ
jgi:hypothetical protein